MNALAVLIDTNVLLDFLIDRGSFTKDAKEIIKKSQEKTINAFLAAHSITNIFYILRKVYPVAERKQRLMDLCQSISIVEIGGEAILNVLANNDFDDIEDCLQAECAGAINAERFSKDVMIAVEESVKKSLLNVKKRYRTASKR